MSQFIKSIALILLLGGSLFVQGKKAFLPNSFQAKFVKEEKAILSGKTLKSEGILYYQYPGRIRLQFEGKDKSVFVSNPFKTFYYKPPVFEGVPGELTINNSQNYPLTKFFDSLNKGINSNDLYTVKDTKGKIELIFTKKGIEELKINKAELVFFKDNSFKNITNLVLELDNKKKLNFELAEIEVEKKLDKGLFSFEAPKNTRVSK